MVTYQKGTVDDAVAKARYYLDHPLERERIAAAGHGLVISKHTIEARSRDLLQILMAENLQSNRPVSLDRKMQKTLAAGRTYLAIALLMADLEALYGDGTYGQRFGWYLQLAEKAMHEVAASDEKILPDLALLAFLKEDYVAAWAYTKLALSNTPDDVELFQLASRVASCRGWATEARSFYQKAAQLISQLQLRSRDLLYVANLVENQKKCWNGLKCRF